MGILDKTVREATSSADWLIRSDSTTTQHSHKGNGRVDWPVNLTFPHVVFLFEASWESPTNLGRHHETDNETTWGHSWFLTQTTGAKLKSSQKRQEYP